MIQETFDYNLATLWEACEGLFDKYTYVNRLEELLRSKGITKKDMILDVSGGFGFPVIDLAKRGYQAVYNDGSQAMFHLAFANSEEQGGPLYPFASANFGFGTVPWQEFNQFGGDCWDALICKGNSLPYAVSWGKENPNLDNAKNEIKSVLGQFHRLLVPKGVLYVDKQPESQDKEIQEIGEVEVRGRKYFLISYIDNDKVNRVRNWKLTTRDLETEEEETYFSQGYLLLEDEFIPMLKEVGFRNIEKYVLEGDIYEGFIAEK